MIECALTQHAWKNIKGHNGYMHNDIIEWSVRWVPNDRLVMLHRIGGELSGIPKALPLNWIGV